MLLTYDNIVCVMSSNYKILLIFPPPASPVSPYLSCPLLAGQLKAAGYNVQSLDLSLEFFYYILNSKFLEYSYNLALIKFDNLKRKIKQFNSKDNNDYIKYKYLEEKLNNTDKYPFVIKNIDENIKKYKDKEFFYNINYMDNLTKQINDAFELAMLPYFPAKCSFSSYYNPLYEFSLEGILSQTEINVEENIFYNFYIDKIEEYNIHNYDLVCVSCPNLTQLIPTFILTRILKEKYNKTICIGGNIISRIDSELIKMPELFNKFFDYILIGPGEESLVNLADYLSNKKNSINIKGLLYKKDGNVIINKPDLKYDISKSSSISLDGLTLNKYFTPDIIMPIQASKGCYWAKCVFCGLHYPRKKYTTKNPIKLVDEIQFLQEKYNINYFEFIDEAIHPDYLVQIADEIIKRKLHIKYLCCLRLEKSFSSDELCQKLYKSGLVLAEFGFETNSRRIYKSLNKGINFDNRKKIISSFSNAGIYTYLYAILGYPTETREEAIDTLLYAKQNKSIVDNMFIHQFWLDKKSIAYKKYKSIGISNLDNQNKNSFVQSCKYTCKKGIDSIEIKKLLAKNLEGNQLKKHIFFAPDEYFFLYVLHYGRAKTKELFL